MPARVLFISLLTLLLSSQALAQQESASPKSNDTRPLEGEKILFAYRHYDNQQYRIVAQVDEQILRNRKLIYSTRILNRIAVEILGVYDGNALLDVNYQVSEEAENGKFFSWAEEKQAQFRMTPQGLYRNLPRNASTPSLRNVPSFPDRPLRPGEGWNAPGSEIHDLSEVFGIPAQLRFDFNAHYIYRGEELFQGRKLQRITLFYNLSQDVSRQIPNNLQPAQDSQFNMTEIPRSVRARHNIELYWDNKLGLPVYQKEDFEVSYLLQSGDEVQFRGRSRGNIIQAEPLPDIRRDVEEELKDAGIAAQVHNNDKGLTISIDSIQFYPDSDRILPGEERKLEKLSRVLQKYPQRDVLITGHTADVGQPETQQRLSEQRAGVVGQFFLDNGIRQREEIVIKGVGANQPVAGNDTEAGRKQNRRVELTLLEN